MARRGRGRPVRSLLGVALAAAALAIILVPSMVLAAASATIRDFAFRPTAVTVSVGETVTWTNRDAVEHNVDWTDAQPSSPMLSQGASYSRTFTRPGTYAYRCAPHPSMTGSVTVVAATGGGGGSDPGGEPPASDAASEPSGVPPAFFALALGAVGIVAFAAGRLVRR